MDVSLSVKIFDAVLLIVLIVALIRGTQRGLVLSLCGLVAILVACWGAGRAANAFSPAVSAWIQPGVAAAVERQLDTSFNSAQADGALDSDAAATLTAVLKTFGVYDEVEAAVRNSVSASLDTVKTAIADSLSHAISDTIARALVYLAAFLAILLLWRFVSGVLNLAARLPGLRLLNTLGGAAFGLLEGLFLLFAAVWLLHNVLGVLPDSLLTQSRILHFLVNYNAAAKLA